jgi:hypothetical protein
MKNDPARIGPFTPSKGRLKVSDGVRSCLIPVGKWRGLSAAVVFGLILSATVAADVITLTDGRVWEGKITAETPLKVTIQTVGGPVDVPRDTIRSIERKPTSRELYEQKLEKLDKTSPNAHYLVGLWCRRHRLPREAEYHLNYAVALDANHAGARDALGHVKYEGKWMPEAEAKEAQGLRFYDGRWMTKEAADIAEAEDLRRDLQRAVARQVRATAQDIVSPLNERHRQQAILRLLNWHDPLAFEAIVKLLRHRDAVVRDVALRAVERLDIPGSDEEVLLHALYDSDDEVRERAQGMTKRAWRFEMLAETVKALANPDEPQVRAAAAKLLGAAKDVRAMDDLIENLYHTYRVRITGGEGEPSIGIIRQRNYVRDVDVRVAKGAVGYDPVVGQAERVEGIGTRWRPLDAPDDPRLVFVVNYAALDALRAITGQDFGVSKTAWREWWEDNRDTFTVWKEIK